MDGPSAAVARRATRTPGKSMAHATTTWHGARPDAPRILSGTSTELP